MSKPFDSPSRQIIVLASDSPWYQSERRFAMPPGISLEHGNMGRDRVYAHLDYCLRRLCAVTSKLPNGTAKP